MNLGIKPYTFREFIDLSINSFILLILSWLGGYIVLHGSLVSMVYLRWLLSENLFILGTLWCHGSITFGLTTIFLNILFISCLAIRNRLKTHDRVRQWCSNIPSNCLLCINDVESRNYYLFSECSFSKAIRVYMLLWRRCSNRILHWD